MAVNSWRGKTSVNIDSVEESIIHRFWTCSQAQKVWTYTSGLLHKLAALDQETQWPLMEWHQVLFASKPPRRFKLVLRFWLLLRGLSLWIIWTSWNHRVFNNETWPDAKVEALLWTGLCDYGRVAWMKYKQIIMWHPERTPKLLEQFDNLWSQSGLICKREELKVSWVRISLATGIG
jgi:hypothetical protein